ncbi:glycosyltransferase [Synechococcus sp. RSCCF101]|nr:glycosyltransferase [Synechococcus sp. RSCCF101]
MTPPGPEAPLSILTVCMNRSHHLQRSAVEVARWPHHQEHLVVDWSSREPLRRQDLPADWRLRLIRVEGERRWNPSRAYNFAAARARGVWLMRMDADCWPTGRCRPAELLAQAALWVGCGGEGRYGQFLMPRRCFERVGGFNEAMAGWGFEDKDLRARLQVQQQLPLALLDTAAIGVIEHSDAERVGQSGRLQAMARQQALAALRASRLHNRLVAAHHPWGQATPASRYSRLPPPAGAGGPQGVGERWQLQAGTLPALPGPLAASLRQTRRRLFWSTLLAIPDVAVEVLPEKLLPADRDGRWTLRWWHRLYWLTVRPLLWAPVALLGLSRGLRERCLGSAAAEPPGDGPP